MGVCPWGQCFRKKVGKEAGNRNGRGGLGGLFAWVVRTHLSEKDLKRICAGVLFRPSLLFLEPHPTGADRPISRGTSEGKAP